MSKLEISVLINFYSLQTKYSNHSTKISVSVVFISTCLKHLIKYGIIFKLKLYLYLSILKLYLYFISLRNRKHRVMLRRNVSSLYIKTSSFAYVNNVYTTEKGLIIDLAKINKFCLPIRKWSSNLMKVFFLNINYFHQLFFLNFLTFYCYRENQWRQYTTDEVSIFCLETTFKKLFNNCRKL